MSGEVIPWPIQKENRLEVGRQFQDFVADTFLRVKGISISNYASGKWQGEKGENAQGIEIKLDRKFRETGNLFIETQECWRPGQELRPAGCTNEKAWLIAQGDYQTFWVLSPRHVLLWAKKNNRKEVSGGVNKKTSMGYLMPCTAADVVCAWKWEGDS